jgi:hypothetical protein
MKVFPNGTTTQGSVIHLLKASNAAGYTTKPLSLGQMATLVQLDESLYHSEHVLFIIPPASQVSWGANSYNEVYSVANRASWVATLKQHFPDDYVYIPLIARNLSPRSRRAR